MAEADPSEEEGFAPQEARITSVSPSGTATPWIVLMLVVAGGVTGYWMRGRMGTREPLPPAGVDGLLELGRQALARGEIGQAEGWFSAAVQLRPQAVEAHKAMADVLILQGQLEEAAEVYAAASLLAPDDPEVRYEWAHLLTRMGEEQQALEVLDGLVTAWPELQEELAEDGRFDPLWDHPRFLAIAGQL